MAFQRFPFSGSLSQSKDSTTFESIFKMSQKTFNYICTLVKAEMMAKASKYTDLNGDPLCLEVRVAIALRRLSSGESVISIADSFRTNRSTVAYVTWRFVQAMEEKAMHHLQWPSTETEMKKIKSKFEEIQGLINCCGAIDTTHIKMFLSAADKSKDLWYDKEKHHSMILQTVVDPDMRFLDIVTGWPGRLSNSLVLTNSSFYKLCEEGKRLNGQTIKLKKNTQLREYIVGDESFPLLPWLVTPHQGENLSEYKVTFNKRHIATQMVAKRALARLKGTWKILEGKIWRPDTNKFPRIVLVCCLLHNIGIDLDDEVQNTVPFYPDHDAGYQQQVCECVDGKGSAMRKKLSHYLSGRLL